MICSHVVSARTLLHKTMSLIISVHIWFIFHNIYLQLLVCLTWLLMCTCRPSVKYWYLQLFNQSLTGTTVQFNSLYS